MTADQEEDRMTETLSGVERIATERQRQLEVEGWDPAHDRGHASELARAAATYATPEEWRTEVAVGGLYFGTTMPDSWPWDVEWWKPTADRIRELEKAGALIAAAIDALIAESGRTA